MLQQHTPCRAIGIAGGCYIGFRLHAQRLDPRTPELLAKSRGLITMKLYQVDRDALKYTHDFVGQFIDK